MNRSSKIFSICVVKNEADIIAHSLAEAEKWSSRIFVLDNGSNDDTWRIVKEMESSVVIPWKQDDRPFCEGLRAEVFNHFRHEAKQGDWWCRFDADEFYPHDPGDFLASVPKRHHVVWGTAIEFYLTKKDISTLEFDSPLQELLPKIRYYRVVNSETRFFRHREGINWPSSAAWPHHIGVVHRKRIPFFHYKFRTPTQIQRRIDTRLETIDRGTQTYWSQLPRDWKSYIVSPETCTCLSGHDLVIDENKLPCHLEPIPRRIIKSIMHGVGIWP